MALYACGFLLSDIDECKKDKNNDCSQVCNNTPGFYTCGCDPGYQLNEDGFTCDATAA